MVTRMIIAACSFLSVGAAALFTLPNEPTAGHDGRVIDVGKTKYALSQVTNGVNKKRFFDIAQTGHSAQWSYDVYTVEGDPIHYVLQYDSGKGVYRVTIDTRDDKYGQPSVTRLTCKGYSIAGNLLTGCDTESGLFPVEGEVLRPMTEQNALDFLKENLKWLEEESVKSVIAVKSVPFQPEETPQNVYFFKASLENGEHFYAIDKKTWRVIRLD